ncbi:neuronal membrane glycoprotein M6-a-like isoform X2 [Mya arenaria]|uniref:neuronal membrane glycoprotein M6-a-like isoform X2 n=1 Tax=Mya arenaria TaxID=6604 RepID=UPI0022E21B1C|nr:neuronal membrane glycoprotein M6-a-like isoform X2 [Mya arenaria]XP_052793710.1 neuronal membrane glycoprotein M6-a-like isoform X2 [Mya arenaria]XP_052793711.1 neuronal membrane glycoprotein M6-a-like isoform X2 [Mya arenaria]
MRQKNGSYRVVRDRMDLSMDNVWEHRPIADENGTLIANHNEEGSHGKAHSDSCLDRTLHCLSHVPCASLLAWILLLIGLGGFTGSLLAGADRTRDLLEEDRLLWFIEYTIIGVVCGMFVIGTCLLIVAHFSSEPSSRHAFNTSSKNTCGRVLNIVMVILSYILCVAWLVTSAILSIPVTALGLLWYLVDFKHVDCINLANYGFDARELCNKDNDRGLERFTNHGKDLLCYYGAALISSFVIIISLIHFLMCMSANITHLRDARFATLNAYEEAEEAPAKPLNDTTM